MGGDRRAAAVARCAEGAPRRHAARGRHALRLRPEQSRSALRARAGAGKQGRARACLGSRQKRWRFRRGACGARARRSMPRRKSFLAANSETSEAGYALIDRAALASAPQEIALRALAQLIGAVGGGETPLQLAKLEVSARRLGGASRQGAYARPLPHRAHVWPARHFPRAEGQGSARDGLLPGMRALWDNRFRIELPADAPEPIMVGRSASSAGASSKSARHSQHRCHGLPAGPCPPAGEGRFSWDFRCLAVGWGTRCRPRLPCDLCQPRRGSAERRTAQAVEKACTSLR